MKKISESSELVYSDGVIWKQTNLIFECDASASMYQIMFFSSKSLFTTMFAKCSKNWKTIFKNSSVFLSFQGDQLQFIPSFVNIELVCCSSKNTGTINNMKVRILTAVLISTYLLVLCAEATIVRKCQGKQVLLNDHSYHKLGITFLRIHHFICAKESSKTSLTNWKFWFWFWRKKKFKTTKIEIVKRISEWAPVHLNLNKSNFLLVRA